MCKRQQSRVSSLRVGLKWGKCSEEGKYLILVKSSSAEQVVTKGQSPHTTTDLSQSQPQED